MEGVNNTKKCY